MSAPRYLGQDTELLIILDGQPMQNISAISSMELMAQLEIIDKGYLGETSNRKDEIFNGYSGSFEAHDSDGSVIDLIFRIVARAQRRVAPMPIITLKTTIKFPASGRRALITLPDLKFGESGIGIGGRAEHGSQRFQFAGDVGRLIFR